MTTPVTGIEGDESAPGGRPSPPTDRVVGVIELLASRPQEGFSLSDIARALGMSKATCHAVTTSLERADYLIRNPADKTFTLGPALVAAGRAAELSYPAVHLAQAELAAIADELSVAASAAIRSEDHLVIVAQCGGSGPDAAASRIGRRIPLAPPFGGVFLAWAGPQAVREWLGRGGAGASETALPASLEAIRERGYSVERLTPAMLGLRAALADLTDDPLAQGIQPTVLDLLAELHHSEYLTGDLDGGGRFPVSAMSAPVFDEHGRTQMNLSVQPQRELTVKEIDRAGRRLLRGCARITAAVGGRPPAADD